MRRPASLRTRLLLTTAAAGLVALAAGEADAVRFVVTELARCRLDPSEGHPVCFDELVTIGLRIEGDPGLDGRLGLGRLAGRDRPSQAWGAIASLNASTAPSIDGPARRIPRRRRRARPSRAPRR